jgi:hypothetical protein
MSIFKRRRHEDMHGNAPSAIQPTQKNHASRYIKREEKRASRHNKNMRAGTTKTCEQAPQERCDNTGDALCMHVYAARLRMCVCVSVCMCLCECM